MLRIPLNIWNKFQKNKNFTSLIKGSVNWIFKLQKDYISKNSSLRQTSSSLSSFRNFLSSSVLGERTSRLPIWPNFCFGRFRETFRLSVRPQPRRPSKPCRRSTSPLSGTWLFPGTSRRWSWLGSSASRWSAYACPEKCRWKHSRRSWKGKKFNWAKVHLYNAI